MDENPLETATDNVHGMQDETINISDVIEVIETDPDFKGSTRMVPQNQRQLAYIRIIEQPAPKALRFRYECEGRSAGSIPGISSTTENKTYPAIQVVGYQGKAVVVVSCVTKDEPYRPHPHNLVGRECKKGVCTTEIPPETMCVTFQNLGIQCVKKKDIESALRLREEIKVDPFMTGFNHRNQPTSIDLNAVRLCFQVFLEGERRGKFTVPLEPVVSEPIYDKKAMSDLAIVKLSDCNSYVDGSRKDIILLCEKVAKEDIQVRFYEEKNGQLVWEGFGDFGPGQVHKQTAIWFKAPRYRTLDITERVQVFIQLRRPSDGATSEPLPFEYLPLDSEPGKRKRPKFDDINAHIKQLEEYGATRNQPFLNVPMEPIKIEPRDKTPSPYGGNVYAGISPNHQGVSPQYMAQTPPLPDFVFQQPQQQQQQQPQDLISVQWNIPSTSRNFNIPNIGTNILPSTTWSQQQQQQIPNIPLQTTSTATTTPTTRSESTSNLICLLDMDSQQSELKQINLNSGDLTFDTNNLSETFTTNLSLTEFDNQNKDNMTDSLTGLVNNTIDNMVLNQ